LLISPYLEIFARLPIRNNKLQSNRILNANLTDLYKGKETVPIAASISVLACFLYVPEILWLV